MGSKSKGKHRPVDFSSGIKMLSDMQDRKQLEYTNNFTTTLSALKTRMEALEQILIDKLGLTEEAINDQVLLKVERNYGFQEVENDVKKGSNILIKVKEEIVGKESDTTPMDNQYIQVGANQLTKGGEIDNLVIGAKKGETRTVVVPNPNNTDQRKLTVTVVKVFKGNEAQYETPEVVPEEPQAASNQ
jgi:hypothetical protein